MPALNRVFIIGNLGRDVEMKYTASGKAVASFSVATKETWQDQQGQKQEKTEWHRIVAWARLAEICGEYLHKGSLVYIEGRLATRSWDDQEKNKHTATEIVANSMQMLGGGAKKSAAEKPPQDPAQKEQTPSTDAKDKIPF